MKKIHTKRQFRLTTRLVAFFTILAFSSSLIIMPPKAQAQSALNLPAPGVMITPTTSFIPAVMKGIKIFPNNPLRFDFIIDTGNTQLEDDSFEKESSKLIKYFLASLTVPEDELWVNLSPYEKDRIIPDKFGVTEMGRDLLAQDYVLKQLTASLIYPEEDLGGEFWNKVYAKAEQLYGTTEIPVNTFNKVWVVPEKARIYESGDIAFIVESHLKVMLEGDYLAFKENMDNGEIGADQIDTDKTKELSDVSSEIIREVILPEIEKEVNNGQNFLALRQIYNSMILATWFKRNLRESLLGKIYVEKNKVSGVDIEDKEIREKIYQQYLEAFKVGVYDYIKEDYDPVTQEIVPRKYFSGGMEFRGELVDEALLVEPKTRGETLAKAEETTDGSLKTVSAVLDPVKNLDRLRRLINVLARSENVPDVTSDATEDQILEFILGHLEQQGLIVETRDEESDVRVFVISDAVKETDLGRAIKRWVMDPKGGVKAINFKGTDGIWKIIGFQNEIDQQIDLERQEVQERKAGKHWIVAHNNARKKLRGGDQQIDQKNAQEQFEVARRDIISASVVDVIDKDVTGVGINDRDGVGIGGIGGIDDRGGRGGGGDIGGGRTSFVSGQARGFRRGIVADLSVQNGYADRPGSHNSEELQKRQEEFLKKYHAENHLIDGSDEEFGDVYEATQDIFNSLIVSAGLEPSSYRILLSDESEPNAFYLRGSNVFVVNIGLLKLGSKNGRVALSRDAVAFVLAHEIQHLRQYRDDVSNGKVDSKMELKVDWKFMTDQRKQEYLDEYDADWNAIDLMSRAGFNVKEAPRIFRLLLDMIRLSGESGKSLYLPFGDHPQLEPRTIELENLVLRRYWPNASKEVTYFSDDLEIQTSRFRDFQNRVSKVSSDEEFADLIMEAQDIRELALVISVGKKRRDEADYQHSIDTSDERNLTLYTLMNLLPKLRQLNETARRSTSDEEYGRLQGEALAILEQLPQIPADLILDIIRGEESEDFRLNNIGAIQSQTNSSGRKILTGSVKGGDVLILKGANTIVVVPTGEVREDGTIEVVTINKKRSFSVKTESLFGSKVIVFQKKRSGFSNPAQPMRAISERIAQMKEDNSAKRLQLGFYEEMLKKHLDRSDRFSSRRVEKTRDLDPLRMKMQDKEVAVADPVEFDTFVQGATTEELINALENLLPIWISLEGYGDDYSAYREFRETLEGVSYGQPAYPRGDYIEFVDAIVRAIEQRVRTGEVPVEIISQVVTALATNKFTGSEAPRSIGEAKLRLFTLFVEWFSGDQVALDRDAVKGLTDLLDSLDFLSDTQSYFGEKNEQATEMQKQVAQLLFDIYRSADMKDSVVELFQKHVKRSSPIKDKFYQLIRDDTNMTLNDKLSAINELGRDNRGFSYLSGIVMKASAGEGDEFVDSIVEEIVVEQPSLASLRTGSNTLRRLAMLTYLGAYSPRGQLIFEAYDAENRELMLSADELRLFRMFIESDFSWRDDFWSLQGLVNVDARNQLVLFLGLLEFLKRNNQDAFIFRILLNLDVDSTLGGFKNRWDYLTGGVASTTKTAEGLAYERDMRTFSMFLGELLKRHVDDDTAEMFGRFSGRKSEADEEEGYSATQMVERLSQTRPQRFGRWDLMQDGDKDHLDYFSFLEQAYFGVNFQDAVSDLVNYFPESRLRDMLIHVLFVQKVLRDKGGIEVSSERLFDFEWLRGQVRENGVSIHDEIQTALRYLGWDRDIQKLNGRFLAESNNKPFSVDTTTYEQERGSYTDVRFYDIGGADSQLALALASLDENFIRTSLSSDQPLEQKLQVLLAYFRSPSAHRDRYVKQVLDQVLRDLEDGWLDLTSSTESQILEFLETFQNVSLRDRFAVRFLEQELARIQNEKGAVELQDELDAILKYFPNFSYVRDEILNQFVNRHVKTTQQYQAVAHLFVQNPDNIRESESADHLFWKDQIRDVFMNFSASAKTEFLLWLMDAGEKPADAIREEYRLQISFEGLKESMGLYDGQFYGGIGRRDQQEFFNSLFLGEQGIFANQTSYSEFLDKLVENLIPSNRKSVRELFKAVLTTDDLTRRQRVLLGLLQNYGQLQGITDAEQKEARTIRIFLEANGLIGVKLGQFLAHSVLVRPDSPLQRELQELNNAAEPIDKGIIFDMLEKIYGGRAFEDHFESLEESLGRASIKVVHRAKRKDGTDVVVKVKRPEVDKLIAQDLEFLEDILTRTASVMEEEGIPVPAGLLSRLKEILEEELNFGDLEEEGAGEANNQRRMQKNIEARKTQVRNGQTYEFVVPISSEVHENTVMVEQFADAIPLKDADALRAQGVDPQAVKELLMEELIQQFFFDGFYHADLHSGNVLIKKEGDTIFVNIIDVGAAATISASNRETLVAILMALWDAENWESNQEIIHRLFPQIQAKEGMEEQLNAVVYSDRNPIQKLMQLFALLEKENIQFQDEYMEFYSVIRFLKASEYLFSNGTLTKMKERFFPSDIDSIKSRVAAITTEVKREFESVQVPSVTTSAEGIRVTVTPETMGQAYDALRRLKDLPFWSTVATPFPQIDQLVNLILGAVSRLKEKGQDLELIIPQDKMATYEDIKSDVQVLIGLIQRGNLGPMTIMSALAAIKRIAAKRDLIVDFLLEQDLPVDEIVDSVGQVAGAEAASRVKDVIKSRDSAMLGLVQRNIVLPAVQSNATTEENVGGIDLNPNMLELQTQGEGIDFDIPIDPQAIQTIQIDGFSPVIFQIAPTNLPMLMGLAETSDQQQLSFAQ